jgi:hypothetical protein
MPSKSIEPSPSAARRPHASTLSTLLALFALVAMLAAPLPVAAQHAAHAAQPEGGGQEMKQEEAPEPPGEPIKKVTQHRLRAGGTDLRYTATAEEIRTEDENASCSSTTTPSSSRSSLESCVTRISRSIALGTEVTPST